ncbi:M48 family metallopeptidase [Winogradskyella immobilis]|uniref:M48 family metallopeptidase n=1 Tax=Winogradskyella immobilis TaxID=2816852 RepID=A0ABS8EKK9_9FLAO|nr:M48 family metallopeptidase [Winogradskyella immobilis]MCC1483736.1 M48 family metallopeptidase [Winogradskyella immobilis]MCG0015830.1 M48 family metallopeptidase [Winogradskyella immobilis]
MKFKHIITTIFGVALFFSCATNPFTGKKTIALVSNNQLFPSSIAQYNQVKSESKIITGTKDAEMIRRVGQRIATAAERWLDANGYQGYLNNYKWEYSLIDSDQVNAWAMPGGKIAFYTGILPIAENETGVAAIMGHEVAHALANHGQQRISKGELQKYIGLGVAVGTSGQSAEAQQAWMQAYGVGSTLGILAYSRKHETESDAIGIKLMAIAGYNPDEASELWKRMKAKSGGQAPPIFLSTHPSNDSRIQNLKNLSQEAKNEAKKYGVTSFRPIN